MPKHIDADAFKEKYLCCGYFPEMSEEEFDDVPAADVAPVVHGRWLRDCFFDEPVTRCSACKVGFAKGHKAERFAYCPHCGAKMDGGAD